MIRTYPTVNTGVGSAKDASGTDVNVKRALDTYTPLFEERRDFSNPTRKFYGRSSVVGAAQTDSVWQIYAEDTVGSSFVRLFANDDDGFIHQWSLRTTYFPPVSFLNQYSLQLTGAANSYCTVPHNATIDFANTAAFSWFHWVKMTSTAAAAFCQKASTATGNNGYTFEVDGSQRLLFTFRGNSGANQLSVRTPALTIANGAWHLIGLTKASGSALASTVKIYYDSVSQSLTTINDTLTETTNNVSALFVGANISGAMRLTANIDEPAIWNAALTQAEVTEIYNLNAGVIDLEAGSGQVASALIAYWRMGDGEFVAIPTIPDEKGTLDMTTQAAVTSGDIESEVAP